MTSIIDRGVLAGTGYDRSTVYEDLEGLAGALLAQQATKRDYIVDTRRMSLTTREGASTLMFDGNDGGDVVSGAVNDHAHGQIAARLEIPVKYYRRMQTEFGELLDQNVNGWLNQSDDRRMVRMLDGRVRAFLSDRYRRLDNLDLMEQAVLPVLRDTPGLTFQVASLTESKLHVNALLPGLAREIKVGDVVQAGISIQNSEVGQGRLKVAPRVWRLSCLNGLLVDAMALSKYHVGRAADEDAYELFTDETLAADDRAFYLKVRDTVAAALSESQFETIVAQLRKTTDPDTAIQNPVAATQLLTDRFSLTETEGGSLLRHLAEGGDMTQWGAVNAMTAAAKQADSFERFTEMEALGGAIAHLADRDWRKIAAAA